MKEVVAKSKQMKVYVDTILAQRSHRVLQAAVDDLVSV